MTELAPESEAKSLFRTVTFNTKPLTGLQIWSIFGLIWILKI